MNHAVSEALASRGRGAVQESGRRVLGSPSPEPERRKREVASREDSSNSSKALGIGSAGGSPVPQSLSSGDAEAEGLLGDDGDPAEIGMTVATDCE